MLETDLTKCTTWCFGMYIGQVGIVTLGIIGIEGVR